MCGRAEDVIPSHMLESYDIDDVIAIVDPPRSGLRKNTLTHLIDFSHFF